MTRTILFVIVGLLAVGCGDAEETGATSATAVNSLPSSVPVPAPSSPSPDPSPSGVTPSPAPSPDPSPTPTPSCPAVLGTIGTWQAVVYSAPDAAHPQFNDTITVDIPLQWTDYGSYALSFGGAVKVTYYTPVTGNGVMNCTYNPNGHLTGTSPVYADVYCPSVVVLPDDNCPSSQLQVSGDWQSLRPGSSPAISQDQTFNYQ